MKMKICDLPSMHRLAQAECVTLADQIEEIKGELDARPFLFERIALCSKRDALIQELRCLEIKAENLSREMEFVRNITVTRNEQRVLMVTIMS